MLNVFFLLFFSTFKTFNLLFSRFFVLALYAIVLFLQPGIRNLLVCVLEVVLVAPHGVCRWTTLADLGFGVAEYEPDVVLGVLFLNEQVFLTVLCEKSPLALDDDAVLQHKVWSVLRGFLWFHIRDNQFLKRKPHTFRCGVKEQN